MAMTQVRLPDSGDLFRVVLKRGEFLQWSLEASIRRFGAKTFKPVQPYPTGIEDQIKYCAKFIPLDSIEALFAVELAKIEKEHPTL